MKRNNSLYSLICIIVLYSCSFSQIEHQETNIDEQLFSTTNENFKFIGMKYIGAKKIYEYQLLSNENSVVYDNYWYRNADTVFIADKYMVDVDSCLNFTPFWIRNKEKYSYSAFCEYKFSPNRERILGGDEINVTIVKESNNIFELAHRIFPVTQEYYFRKFIFSPERGILSYEIKDGEIYNFGW